MTQPPRSTAQIIASQALYAVCIIACPSRPPADDHRSALALEPDDLFIDVGVEIAAAVMLQVEGIEVEGEAVVVHSVVRR